MKKFLIVSTDEILNDRLVGVISRFPEASVSVKDDLEDAMQYLHYELPDIILMNFGDRVLNMNYASQKISEDLWLNNGGLIAVFSEANEDDFLEKIDQSHILAAISDKHVERRLPGLIKILMKNEYLIFQRDMPRDVFSGIKGTFVLDNDPFDATVYANLLSLYLYNANFISLSAKNLLKNALVELLMNAIEHGNCRISFEEKSRELKAGKTIFELIHEKNRDPDISLKKVTLLFECQRDFSTFRIRDEGEGFDWQKQKARSIAESGHQLMSGRGLLMTLDAVRNLRYNNQGTEAVFDISHQGHKTNLRPQIFEGKKEINYNEGDIVFRKGETGNFIAYIVSGVFNVLNVKGEKIASLSPNDIFIGEMAFLLGNARTATVQADTTATLIKLSKDEFVSNIRKYPYYGLFLARILAQRMEKINRDMFAGQERSLDDYLADAREKFSAGKMKEAINLLKLAETFFPSNSRILFHLANYSAAIGKFGESLDYIADYLSSKPDDPAAYAIRAYNFTKKGQTQLAREALEKGLSFNRAHADLLFNLVKLDMEERKWSEADVTLKRLEALFPRHEKVTKLRSQLVKEMK